MKRQCDVVDNARGRAKTPPKYLLARNFLIVCSLYNISTTVCPFALWLSFSTIFFVASNF